MMELASITKEYPDYQKNPVTGKYERIGTLTLKVTLPSEGDCLIFEKNEAAKKVNVKVDEHDEYVYQIRKTFIRAKNGAKGLFSFLSDPTFDDYILMISNRVFDYMK